MSATTIIALIAGLLILIAIIIYNTLISKRNQVDNAYSAIDAMLKKRFDLIPNLVETVKQYMQHESNVLESVTKQRVGASDAGVSIAVKNEADREISDAVRSVILNAENYPDLKANQNFLNLQSAWNNSEEQIAAARRAYNASVTDYNNSIMMFPGNLMAGPMNYSKMEVLSIPETERENLNAAELFGKA